MTTATLSPFSTQSASKVGKRVYRKQVLPLGTITYKGQKITFDKPFLTDLAESFKSGAYDQVPFVLADPDNRHNMDPERFRGEVKGFELSNDGLDAIVEFTPEGAAVVEQNPRLGVSARIVEGLAKADGRTFKRAIQHVLGTMDPRVTGLRPWTAIDLAVYTDGEQVVDLTDATYTEEPQMTAPAQDAPAAQNTEDQPLDLSGLSDEEFDALLAAAEKDEEDPKDEPGNPKPGTQAQDADAPQDVDLSTVQDSADDITPGNVDKANQAPTPTPQQQPQGGGILDLANDVLSSQDRSDLQQMRIDLANERWKSERKDLVRAGVPPFILDLAAPVLSAPESAVIDLSTSDDPVNATEVIRSLVEGMKGIVDITPEVGHSVDLSVETSEDERLMQAWDDQYGR